MNRQNFGEIAALEYHAPPQMGFPDIVEEFDIASLALATQVRRLTWDGDDIALIDRERVRFALGWLPPAHEDNPHYLVIAVGAPARKRRAAFDPSAYSELLNRAIERVQGYLPFDAILRGPAAEPVGSALIDRSFDLLSATAPRLSAEILAEARNRRTMAVTDSWASGALEPGNLPAIPSVPLRLTIVTLGLTLFLHVPPIGAALLTYTVLREAQPLFAS
ncbi:hypothetical protein [Roseovarius autotrophicus]|uniref:hypothetical protein n=1 Tax=Roseovarius autotrophicus TaxID=2824121 RepID=UPI0019E52D9C|nr:hypothetical protein [Roseovarius autotrophicus]MBE0454204.1 hypothetical protein [Roseovarius sp.]